MACTPAPEGANYWKQVQREWESRDYLDTLNYLNDVLRSENTFNERAAALKVTILGGMARAALEIEDACATGIHLVAQWETKPYKNCIDQFRFQARSRTLGLMDALGDFDKATAVAETVSLDFSLPKASAAPSSMVGRTRVGAMPVEKVFEPAVERVVDRQLVLQVQDLVGAAELSAAVGMFESQSRRHWVVSRSLALCSRPRRKAAFCRFAAAVFHSSGRLEKCAIPRIRHLGHGF